MTPIIKLSGELKGMNPVMHEKRHLPRRETLAFWPAHHAETGELIGTVADLTEEGLMLHSLRTFQTGEELNIHMAVDKRLTGVPQLSFHITNVWCKENRLDNLTRAGFRITHLSDVSRVGIRDLLEAFSYPAPHPESV
jgi:PilZ domain